MSVPAVERMSCGCNVGHEQVEQTPGAPTGETRGSEGSAQDPPSQHPSLSPGQSLWKAADPGGPADGVWDPQASTDGRVPVTGLPGADTSPHANYNDDRLPGPVHVVPMLTRSVCA